MEGIRAAMEAVGLEEHLRVLVSENENEGLDSTYEFDCGVKMTEELLENHPECTAIIAVNDMTAMGCISVLNQRGLCMPEDMAICAFDNLYLDKIMSPQLTFHGCKVGLSILLEKMKNFSSEDMPVFMEYKPRLHVRGTTVKE